MDGAARVLARRHDRESRRGSKGGLLAASCPPEPTNDTANGASGTKSQIRRFVPLAERAETVSPSPKTQPASGASAASDLTVRATFLSEPSASDHQREIDRPSKLVVPVCFVKNESPNRLGGNEDDTKTNGSPPSFRSPKAAILLS